MVCTRFGYTFVDSPKRTPPFRRCPCTQTVPPCNPCCMTSDPQPLRASQQTRSSGRTAPVYPSTSCPSRASFLGFGVLFSISKMMFEFPDRISSFHFQFEIRFRFPVRISMSMSVFGGWQQKTAKKKQERKKTEQTAGRRKKRKKM